MNPKQINVKAFIYIAFGGLAIVFLGSSIAWYLKVGTFVLLGVIAFLKYGRRGPKKPFKERMAFTYKKAGLAWIVFWFAVWWPSYVHDPEFAKGLIILWGINSYSVGFTVMTVVLYLINLGTFASAGGEEGYKFPRFLTISLLIYYLVSFFGSVFPPVRELPLGTYLYDFGDNEYRVSSFAPFPQFESEVGSPMPGKFVGHVAPEGRNPDGSLKMLKIADLESGKKTIELKRLAGRVRLEGRTTRFADGRIFAEVFMDDEWNLEQLESDESPLYLLVGGRTWRLSGPGKVLIDITASTPLYLVVVSDERGSGLVEFDLSVSG